MKRYLPLGSVVKVQDIDQRVLIVGFKKKAVEDEKVWDYCGVFSPIGIIDTEKVLMFDDDAIETIFFIGLQDQETFAFMKMLQEEDANENTNK